MEEIYKITNVLDDIPDERDYIFADTLNEDLPKEVDHRQWMREIENQGSTGSCVANATVSSLELFAKKAGLEINLSRLFHYYNLREPYDNLKEIDSGSYTKDGFKFANQLGICTEDLWKFNISEVNTKPNNDCYTKALENLVDVYERIITSKDDTQIKLMQLAVAKGYPLLFSMNLDKTFYDLKSIGSLKNMKYKGVQDNYIGGHAMNIVGYSDELQGFIVENSWGSSWGEKGCCLISYDVIKKDSKDVWVCTGFKGLTIDEEYNYVEPEELIKGSTITKYYEVIDGLSEKDQKIPIEYSVSGGTKPYTITYHNLISDSVIIEDDNIIVNMGDSDNKYITVQVTDSSYIPQTIYATFTVKPLEYVEPEEPEEPEDWKDKLKDNAPFIIIGLVMLSTLIYNYLI